MLATVKTRPTIWKSIYSDWMVKRPAMSVAGVPKTTKNNIPHCTRRYFLQTHPSCVPTSSATPLFRPQSR